MSDDRRVFTLEEANGALPFVRRVVKDIVETHKEISELYGHWRRSVDNGNQSSADEFERNIRELLDAKDHFLGELDQVGCEFKDLQQGLVDFPARLDDRVVYLCWRLGEPHIRFWHETTVGFSGRRSIDGCFELGGIGALCESADGRGDGDSDETP